MRLVRVEQFLPLAALLSALMFVAVAAAWVTSIAHPREILWRRGAVTDQFLVSAHGGITLLERRHRTPLAYVVDNNRRAHRVVLMRYSWLVGLTLVLPAVWGARRYATWRVVQGRCTRCGYDLRATPERCPECGTVPSRASAPAA